MRCRFTVAPVLAYGVVAALVLVAVALTACATSTTGDDPETSPAAAKERLATQIAQLVDVDTQSQPTGANVAELLSLGEVERILGKDKLAFALSEGWGNWPIADPSDLATITGTFGVVDEGEGSGSAPYVIIRVSDLATFAEMARGRTAVREVITGLGDAAYTGPKAGDEPTSIAFRKGDRGVLISTNKVDDKRVRVVSAEQLREIANSIAARMD